MFNKKCPRCANKIKSDFKFCPSCSLNLNTKHDQEDYGFLGKDDLVEGNLSESMPMTGFSDTFMDKMFNSAMKMLEKQMRNMQSEMNDPRQNRSQHSKQDPGLNVQFFVNGKKVFPDGQKKEMLSNKQEPIKMQSKISSEKMKKFADLPRVEPKTKMKRLSGKVIYELAVPGVKDINDILINQLENSIEIKAFSSKKVYSKNLNVKLPILGYGLKGSDLVIEMQGQ
mgnify:CR=1 FL=1|jgi:hypothetical protein